MSERRSVKECADAIGVQTGLFRAYEEDAVPLPART